MQNILTSSLLYLIKNKTFYKIIIYIQKTTIICLNINFKAQ